MYYLFFLALFLTPVLLAADSRPQQRFVEVDGCHFHVEQLGSGDPMVVVHGGTQCNDDMRELIDALVEHYHVYAIESRAHGLSDGDFRDISYAQELKDLLAVTSELGLSSFHYCGHSDGAIVGVMLALEHPERLRSLVAISGNVHHNGVKAEVTQWLATAPSDQVPPALRAGFAKRDDRGATFDAFWQHMSQLWRSSPELELSSLAAIKTATLYVFADRDTIALSHAVDMFEATPDAKILVLPGASHDVATMHTGSLIAAIRALTS